MSFEEFLALDTAEQIEQVFGIKLKWHQKLLVKWWAPMKRKMVKMSHALGVCGLSVKACSFRGNEKGVSDDKGE